MTILVLLGAPGAGKGTQAHILARELGMTRLATGDMFRAAVAAGTPLGVEAKTYMDRGEFVPDGVTVRMLLERLAAHDAENGVILDGFPRNRAQAEALDAALATDGSAVGAALYIEVPVEELLLRLTGRWLCQAEGHTYHEVSSPPRAVGVCDHDGSPLIQRADDRTEVVQARLANQLAPLEEVVAYYRPRGVLRTVDGRRSIEEVTTDLLAQLRGGGDPAEPGR